ncbi:hypothetical protein PTSG_11347 [Salpingoeca rosetta]|uniref:C2 domain-containing protein n=1 Tax=Salpingoeca rosetta (strain ATCC 50818 / BSB-021) TaxID=946362 RepID=F2UT52_SALR5|nr:uncharacterized protein PTSG_11347 [Salpingoeca rosetta]EGD81311.1 hypothetical protein PTSG_11347 [Salpingoeca rosetta]|eukprot:XP_004987707.1 hypothetical protein PTSG_11347 [Salpingoeca rosetta]
MSAAPHSRLQLHISCSHLKRADALSKSDPFVVVLLASPSGYVEIGRTEVIKNDSNPKFADEVDIDYYFESVQDLRFCVYVTLPLMSTLRVLKNTRGGKTSGSITVNAEEDRQAKGDVSFKAHGVGLDKKDFFGKSDPFITISRQSATGWVRVHTTEVVKKTLDPTWRPFTITVGELCNGDYTRPLKFDVFDWDSDGGHDLIGSAESTLNDLIATKGSTLELINAKKAAKKKKYTNSGTLVFDSVEIVPTFSFIDYLRAGFKMNFTVAVDMTASNGRPDLPSSLHYMNPSRPNAYMQAIQSVGTIISDYDADKYFPAFAFGCRYRGQVSMEHPLTGDPANPYCQGVQGLLAMYQATLQNVELYGPTNMAPIINHVARFAVNPEDKSYYVLLIITDGVISDMDATTKAIVDASHLPMSIIIVGVGNADFSAMSFLDADVQPLSYGGRDAVRDIVQFVPFNQYSTRPDSQAALASAVLAEVPGQFESFMRAKGITPA